MSEPGDRAARNASTYAALLADMEARRQAADDIVVREMALVRETSPPAGLDGPRR